MVFRHLQLVLASLAILLLPVFSFEVYLKKPSSTRISTSSSIMTTTTAIPLSVQEDMAAERPKVAILRVQGPDCKGIVAAFAQVLYGQ